MKNSFKVLTEIDNENPLSENLAKMMDLVEQHNARIQRMLLNEYTEDFQKEKIIELRKRMEELLKKPVG